MWFLRVAAFLLLLLSTAGCGGSGPSQAPLPTGLWEGSRTEGAPPAPVPLQMVFLPDGEVLCRIGVGLSTHGIGTWTHQGGAVSAQYYSYGLVYAVAATVGSGTLEGTWGVLPSSTDGGAIDVSKAITGGAAAWMGSTSATPSGRFLLVAWPGGDLGFYDNDNFHGLAGAGTWSTLGGAFLAEFTFDASAGRSPLTPSATTWTATSAAVGGAP
jgi:hypothetical protein